MATQKDVTDYLNENSGILDRHMHWHMVRHTGTEFLFFHRDIISGFEKWLKKKNKKSLQAWIPQPKYIEAIFRKRFIEDRNLLKQSKIKLQQKFSNKNELGAFIQGGIHVRVHNSFRPKAEGGNGLDLVFASLRSPISLHFWTWHKWINMVWHKSDL
ncbi:MAG TPA: hypothetical protein VJY62_18325 [Bacteroidia bacterium]|nr:hypothetical protein [Bacteroidia bacterium]